MLTLISTTTLSLQTRFIYHLSEFYIFRKGIELIESLLKAPGLGVVTSTPDHLMIHNNIGKFMRTVIHHMNQMDSRLDVYMQYAGSVAEGTKVGLPDEYDIQLHIGGLQGLFQTIQDPETEDLILSISKKSAAKVWAPFIDTNLQLQPNNLYSYLWRLLCLALSKKDVYEGLLIYWKHIDTDQSEVHLEWAPTHMAVKLDVAFCVSVHDWLPEKSRKRSPILAGHTIENYCHVLVLPNSWKPTPFAREQLVMKCLPMVPRLAYIMVKILNSLIVYQKDNPNKLKSYDIKNALFCELHNNTEVMNEMKDNVWSQFKQQCSLKDSNSEEPICSNIYNDSNSVEVANDKTHEWKTCLYRRHDLKRCIWHGVSPVDMEGISHKKLCEMSITSHLSS